MAHFFHICNVFLLLHLYMVISFKTEAQSFAIFLFLYIVAHVKDMCYKFATTAN